MVDEQVAYPGIESIVRRCKVLEVSYTALPMNVTCRMVSGGGLDMADADKSRKALLEAKVPDRVMADFGVRAKRTIVLR